MKICSVEAELFHWRTDRHYEANVHYSQFCECNSKPSYVNFTLKINFPLHCVYFMWSSNNFQNCTLFSGHMPDVWALRRLSVAPRWILGQFRSTESKACVAQLLGTIYKIKQVFMTSQSSGMCVTIQGQQTFLILKASDENHFQYKRSQQCAGPHSITGKTSKWTKRTDGPHVWGP